MEIARSPWLVLIRLVSGNGHATSATRSQSPNLLIKPSADQYMQPGVPVHLRAEHIIVNLSNDQNRRDGPQSASPVTSWLMGRRRACGRLHSTGNQGDLRVLCKYPELSLSGDRSTTEVQGFYDDLFSDPVDY